MEPCDRTREARCSFEKRREYTSVESQQLDRQGVAAVWISFDRGTSDTLTIAAAQLKIVSSVYVEPHSNDRNWAGADLRAQHERCNYTEIFRASGLNGHLYTRPTG